MACEKNKINTFDEKLIEKMAGQETKLPSVFSSIPFFGICSNNRVALVYVQDLRAIHTAKYKKIGYSEFLQKTLNQQISVEYQDKIECFDLDKDVTTDYESKDFENFLHSYTEKTSSGKLALKPSVPEDNINSILYYLFLNNYLASYDDYIGKFYIYSSDSLNNK